MIPTISTIPLLQFASGDRFSLQLYKFVGAQPGKKVYIQSNLHGAEVAGNVVIHQLIEFLTTLDATDLGGEIWLVPVCNPLGVNARSHHFSSGRFNAYDGRDWNRIFWDYEKANENLANFAKIQIDLDLATIRQNYLQQIKAEFDKLLELIQAPSRVPFSEIYRYKLQALCIDADYLIDLHSSSDQGLDYLYYFQHRESSAKFFLMDYGILLDEYDGDAFDEAFIKPWLALEKELLGLGRKVQFDVEAWTLELGTGMKVNAPSVAAGFRGVKNYLVQKGVLNVADIDPDSGEAMNFRRRSEVKKYYAIAGGMIQARIELGSIIQAGEWLYQLLSFNKEEIPTLVDVYAEQAGIVYDVSTNHAVNEGEYVLSMM